MTATDDMTVQTPEGTNLSIAQYQEHQRRLIGPNPLADGAQDWPDWTATETRELSREDALSGWRMWSLIDGQLCAPFLAEQYRRIITWLPGVNTNDTAFCPSSNTRHPTNDCSCSCGVRVVQSQTVLRAYARGAAAGSPVAQPMTAWGEVAIWGHVAPLIPTEDWIHTIRAEYAQITDTLHVAASVSTQEREQLGDLYKVPTIVDRRGHTLTLDEHRARAGVR